MAANAEGSGYESNNDISVIALDSRQVRPCSRARAGFRSGRLTAFVFAAQPLDEVGSKTVTGDACAPLVGNDDATHVLTREEEKLHMAHGHAKRERRAALGSEEGTVTKGGFFSRAGKARARRWADA